jgi:hypothetical protein
MVVCMTRQLDTLHEEPLRTEDFGEGTLPSKTSCYRILTYRQIHQCWLGVEINSVPRISRESLSRNLSSDSTPLPPNRRRLTYNNLPRRRLILRSIVTRLLSFICRREAPSPYILSRGQFRLHSQIISYIRKPTRSRGSGQLETEWKFDIGFGEVWI